MRKMQVVDSKEVYLFHLNHRVQGTKAMALSFSLGISSPMESIMVQAEFGTPLLKVTSRRRHSDRSLVLNPFRGPNPRGSIKGSRPTISSDYLSLQTFFQHTYHSKCKNFNTLNSHYQLSIKLIAGGGERGALI